MEINNSFCPHSCVVEWPIMAPSAKPWAIHIINQFSVAETIHMSLDVFRMEAMAY